jgi:zinc D-Ala-D-Ala carboxypeptidase
MPLRVMTAIGLMLMLNACSSPLPPPTEPTTPPATQPAGSASDEDGDAFAIGAAATDTFGGWLHDGKTLTPFDVSNPIIGLMDPLLLRAIQDAARGAASEGIELKVTSGWRSKGFQQQLFDDGVRTYGSIDAARQFVASPERSMHVVGKAVDIGATDADEWLIRNGSRFGLCQIYANEIWHFELATDKDGNCPPLKPNAAG